MALGRVTILNVDDNEPARYARTQLLGQAGFRVLEAPDGTTALRLARELPDVVLLDIRLPDVSGYEVCRRIKADPELASTVVVHLTAHRVQEADRLQSLEGGADGYLVQPISRDVLIATVRAYVRLHQAEAIQRFLARASAELATPTDSEELLRRVPAIVVPTLADVAFVHALEGEELRFVAAAGDGSAAGVLDAAGRSITGLEAFGERGRHLLTGRSARWPAEGEPATPLPGELAKADLTSIHVTPLEVRGTTLGVLTLGLRADRALARELVETAHDLARRAALSLDAARLYEKAQQAVATRENLIAIVSHDLKTPLSGIVTSCDLLDRAVRGDPIAERIGRNTQVIRRQARRMTALIGDLLDLARIDAGLLPLTRATEDLAALLEEAIELMQPLAIQKRQVIRGELGLDGLQVSCDRERVLQVMSNLVGNAIKFTPEGGTTVIRAERRAGEVRVLVIDSGPGLTPEMLPRLFDRYWQGHAQREHGTGLGLSIAKGVVEAHGGQIGADSTPSAGSTFWFTLPAPASTAAGAPQKAE